MAERPTDQLCFFKLFHRFRRDTERTKDGFWPRQAQFTMSSYAPQMAQGPRADPDRQDARSRGWPEHRQREKWPHLPLLNSHRCPNLVTAYLHLQEKNRPRSCYRLDRVLLAPFSRLLVALRLSHLIQRITTIVEDSPTQPSPAYAVLRRPGTSSQSKSARVTKKSVDTFHRPEKHETPTVVVQPQSGT